MNETHAGLISRMAEFRQKMKADGAYAERAKKRAAAANPLVDTRAYRTAQAMAALDKRGVDARTAGQAVTELLGASPAGQKRSYRVRRIPPGLKKGM
jgi:hypothetical protein